jgi:uncharacterized membrane protein YphA (DoxX/SURF4 family)
VLAVDTMGAVYWIVTILLVVAFALAGTMKLTGAVDANTHNEMNTLFSSRLGENEHV